MHVVILLHTGYFVDPIVCFKHVDDEPVVGAVVDCVPCQLIPRRITGTMLADGHKKHQTSVGLSLPNQPSLTVCAPETIETKFLAQAGVCER
jgi:hypothetical protein